MWFNLSYLLDKESFRPFLSLTILVKERSSFKTKSTEDVLYLGRLCFDSKNMWKYKIIINYITLKERIDSTCTQGSSLVYNIHLLRRRYRQKRALRKWKKKNEKNPHLSLSMPSAPFPSVSKAINYLPQREKMLNRGLEVASIVVVIVINIAAQRSTVRWWEKTAKV
jgi:hypothetical protein